MGYEVNFLQVGNGETSGDCIVLRYGDLHSGDAMKQYIIVIDGGFKESGQKLVDFIIKHYKTTYVDMVISTHLDRDHIAGLTPVLEQLQVGRLYMHRPWLHSTRADENVQKEAIEARKSYGNAASLEELAIEKDVSIIEPFTGQKVSFGNDGYLHILGPDPLYYEHLLSDFDHNKSLVNKLAEAINKAATTIDEAIKKVQETLDPSTETLDHVHKDTSSENSSSVIAYFNFDGKHLLFTGDAGVEALHRAADYADTQAIPLTQLSFLDVPHHGSKHNVDSRFLNRVRAETAFISATKDSKKHPSPRVRNALVRRNFSLSTTEESNIRHQFNAPDLEGYSPVTPLGFISEFEDDE